MNFKKTLSTTSAVLFSALLLAGCSNTTPHEGGSQVLRVLNWEDYIYLNDPENGYDAKNLVDQFEDFMLESEGLEVEVVYDTFDTNETMLNSLQTGKSVYDLVCPSDYMIQKMIANDMLEPLDNVAVNIPNYEQYASPYLKTIFENLEAKNKTTNELHSVSEYAVGYMWGTFGILFNPIYPAFASQGLSPEAVMLDMEDWNSLWDEKYQDTISLKDSMRETYSVGIMRVYDQEIRALQAMYLDPESPTYNDLDTYENNLVTYNQLLTEIYNRCDAETVALVKEELLILKENIYGFENDSGKQDIVTGKIGINLAWSGDAVYAMNQAEEELGTELYYTMPETGGNIWFDGWVMPKSESLNKELAAKFLNFLSDPVNAAQNMDYIGYSSFIGGEDINALVHEWYDVRGEEWETPLANPENYVAYDLTYFFGDTVDTETVIYIEQESVGRQLYAQYPEADMIPRLSLMRDFGDNNRYVLAMWEEFKSSSLPGWAIALIAVGALAVAGFGGFFFYRKSLTKKNRRARREQTSSSRR
ncbi:MAG: extracellular solute-binding protein [Bacilli bacterium]|jgi:spermidine/putrescine transport system substrate-binding protein